MRLATDHAGALHLVATARDIELIDAAFELVLNGSPVDDWQVRTGASQEELWRVWVALAGNRPDRTPDDDGLAIEVSERALEVLEPVLFALARARLVPSAELEALTGASLAEWQRLWRRTRELRDAAGLRLELDVEGRHRMELGTVPGDRWCGCIRQVGGSLVRASVEGFTFDTVEAISTLVEESTFADLVCRSVRLVECRIANSSFAGSMTGGAIIDCQLEDVRFTGTLDRVAFVGNAFRGVDLRAAMLVDCRFYDLGAERLASLPNGRDCFIIPVRAVPIALETIRARVGEEAIDACREWAWSEEADFVSVTHAFWRSTLVPRGAPDDEEAELALLDRLFRYRVPRLEAARAVVVRTHH